MDRVHQLWHDVADAVPKIRPVWCATSTHTTPQSHRVCYCDDTLSGLRRFVSQGIAVGTSSRKDVTQHVAEFKSDRSPHTLDWYTDLKKHLADFKATAHETPGSLAWYAARGNVSACLYLLTRPMSRHDLSKMVRQSNNKAFGMAAGNGHLEVCQLLKEYACLTTNDMRDDNNLALRKAAENGHVHVLQFLMACRNSTEQEDDRFTLQDIRAPDDYGSPNAAFRHAAQCGHMAVLQFLKDFRDADGSRLMVEDVRSNGNYAMWLASENGHLDVLQFLRDFQDPDGSRLTLADVRTNNCCIPLSAARNGHVHVLQFFKEWRDVVPNKAKRDSVPIQDEISENGDHFACVTTSPGKAVEIKSRLTIEDMRTFDNYALRQAAQNGHVHVLQLLREWREEIPDRARPVPEQFRLTSKDTYAFHDYAMKMAVGNGHTRVCEFLRSWREQEPYENTEPDTCPNLYQMVTDWERRHYGEHV